MFRLTSPNAIRTISPGSADHWENAPLSQRPIWKYCLAVLAQDPVDIERMRSFCRIIRSNGKYDKQSKRIIRRRAWKCDIESMTQIYDATSRLPKRTRNEIREMFLAVFSHNPYPITVAELKKLHQLQKKNH